MKYCGRIDLFPKVWDENVTPMSRCIDPVVGGRGVDIRIYRTSVDARLIWRALLFNAKN